MSAGDVEGFAIDPTVVRAWKRYPAYKDSGVEWLGEVPEHWDVAKLRYVCRYLTPSSIRSPRFQRRCAISKRGWEWNYSLSERNSLGIR